MEIYSAPPRPAACPLDFPPASAPEFSRDPAALGAEGTSLASLIHHRHELDAQTSLEAAYGAFRTHRVDYMAVTRAGGVIGLCSRGQVGFIMGSRFGFALYSESAVATAMVPLPLVVAIDTPVRRVLDLALARHGDCFHEDVILVDRAGRLVGLIQAETLAQLQSRLVAEQLEALRTQHETLRRQNLELFHANHAARQSQGLYLGLFEGHALGVALLDPEGGIHEHNRRLGELLGFADSPASFISLVAWIDEKERDGFLKLLQQYAHGGAAPATREFTFDVPGRGPRIFRCSTGWIKETGQICACLDDLTDQRLLERKLLRQEKQTLLDTLVGGIAHELNNKLTPVMGFAEILSIEDRRDVGVLAGHIQQSVAEAAHIIRQLLQLSKPPAPVSSAVDLRTVVEETLTMLRFQFRQAACEIDTRLPPEPVWVLADAGQMKQVALNLCLNAVQAMEARAERRLSIALRATGRWVAMIVSDTGCGIPPENLARIFDPFFTTKGPERGSGLGLSISYSIVRQHGGEIAVDSRPGMGSCVTVTLPRGDPPPAMFTAAPVAEPAPLAREDHPGARVLVVDDEIVVGMLLQEMLRTRFGCRADHAANGAEALAAIERIEYHLVISDVQMPVMNGLELFRRLGERWPALAARFVFVTGYPGGRHLDSEIAQWNVPVIAKPFTLGRITEVCAPFLRAASGVR